MCVVNKIILKNIILNFFIAVVFLLLNNWALEKSLEETFIFLAITYGVTTIIINASFVSRLLKK